METTPVEQKRAKERSPSFPFITLARALERAQEFYADERRGAAPFSRTVMHWKYSESSSGALQTVAALKQYGLMEDVGGAGKGRQLKLSELAIRILLDQREDSTERDANIQKAALNPAVVAEVYQKWPELPTTKDSTLSHFLMIDKKFSETNTASVVKILKENHRFAKFGDAPVQSSKEDAEGEYVNDSPSENEQEQPSEERKPFGWLRQSARKPAPQPAAAAPAQLLLRHKGVSISLQFSEEPSREVMQYLERYFAFEKENAPTLEELRQQQGATVQET